MAIRFKTNDPKKLLEDFKKAIDKDIIVTWSYDQDGDFTHTSTQWKNKAWLHPEIKTSELVFSIIKQKSNNISSLIYAVYHGRFIQSMLNHFDSSFSNAETTALPSEDDLVS